MKQTLKICAMAMLLLASCAKQEQNNCQQQMKQAAELGTVQYTVQKVISNNDERWQLFGNRKILFSFKAIVKAGIDMEKFNPETIKIDENKKNKSKAITLTLPQPEIFTYNIRPDDVQMIYHQVSSMRSEYSNAERDAIVASGELELKADDELRQMILKDARQNAITFFEMLLRQNGFTDVTILFNQEKDK